jgi:hypothetical protein
MIACKHNMRLACRFSGFRVFSVSARLYGGNNNTNGEIMAEGNKPDATAYTVREFTTSPEGGKSEKRAMWNKVGSAWLHKDGKGFNVQLESLPVNGRLVIRVNDKESGAGAPKE